MTSARIQLGRAGEDLAEAYLKRAGFHIRHRNVRYPVGELDLVADDHGVIVFVEVKARRSRRYGSPQDAVDSRRRGRLVRAARWYLQEHRLAEHDARFDVVGISPDGVEHERNAFSVDPF